MPNITQINIEYDYDADHALRPKIFTRRINWLANLLARGGYHYRCFLNRVEIVLRSQFAAVIHDLMVTVV